MDHIKLITAIADFRKAVQRLTEQVNQPDFDIDAEDSVEERLLFAMRDLRGLFESLGNDVNNGPLFQEFMSLNGTTFGMMMLNSPVTLQGRMDEPLPDGRVNKYLAVDASDVIGPDWCQAWYRFVVLMTKLA